MNIFYLDEDPTLAAQYQSDKHIIKMILESAQLLSTAHRVLDGHETITLSAAGRKYKRFVFDDEREEWYYKSTHINHPSAIWVRESAEHYEWLVNHLVALLGEYTYRYRKTHATSRILPYLYLHPKNIANTTFVPPPCAMPSEYIISNDTVLNYRYYYVKAKADLLQYTKRDKPSWMEEY